MQLSQPQGRAVPVVRAFDLHPPCFVSHAKRTESSNTAEFLRLNAATEVSTNSAPSSPPSGSWLSFIARKLAVKRTLQDILLLDSVEPCSQLRSFSLCAQLSPYQKKEEKTKTERTKRRACLAQFPFPAALSLCFQQVGTARNNGARSPTLRPGPLSQPRRAHLAGSSFGPVTRGERH